MVKEKRKGKAQRVGDEQQNSGMFREEKKREKVQNDSPTRHKRKCTPAPESSIT